MNQRQAEASLRRLYDAGCGTDQTPSERTAALRPRMSPFCGQRVPAVTGNDSLCLRELRAATILLYRDDSQIKGQLQELERLRDWQERFGPHGLVVVHVAREGNVYSGNGDHPYRERDQVIEVMEEHRFPFVSLISNAEDWPEEMTWRTHHVRLLALIDREGVLRLRQRRAWTDSAITRQDHVVNELLRQLTSPQTKVATVEDRLSVESTYPTGR